MFKKFKYSSEKNIGGTIKRIAQNCMWFDTVAFFIGGIVMIFFGIAYGELGFSFGGMAIFLVAPFVAYLANLPIYAFGELVENSTITAGKIPLESAGTVGASEVIFFGDRSNKEQGFFTKMKESDTDRKKIGA